MERSDIVGGNAAANAAVRVPAITIYFWIVKILTTGAGESASDFLGVRFPHVIGGSIGGVGLLLALVLQFRMRRYYAWTYWFAIVMVAIAGTMAADVIHSLGVSYLESTVALLIILVVIFAAWYRSQGTLSIHSITTAGREGFYWATVMATFALGTAAGDLTATTFGWGYFMSGIVFGIAILVVGLAHYVTRRALPAGHRHHATSGVLAFWLAYILTRPLGASFADWAGKPPAQSGLGFGDGTVAAVLLVVIFLLVAYLAVSRADVLLDPTSERMVGANAAAPSVQA